MATTTKVKEVLQRVTTLLLDSSPQFNRWPESDLVNWLNDGQLAIAKYFPVAASRIDSIKLKPGSLQCIDTIAATDCKPDDGSTPTAPIYGIELFGLECNMGSDGLTPGITIGEPVDKRLLDSQNPAWQSTTGTTVYDYTYDPRTPNYFHVQPAVPATPAVWVRMSYAARPLPIANTGSVGAERYLIGGANNDLIGLQDECVDDLVNYVVARAHMTSSKFADMNKAQAFASLFTASINSKAAALTGHNPNLERLPFAPTPMAEAQ